jgi:hypothetical protein
VSPKGTPDKPVLVLQSLSAENGSFDLAQNKLVLPKLELSRGSILVAVAKDGSVNWQQLLHTGEAAPRMSARNPLGIGIDALAMNDISVRYFNERSATPMQLRAENVNAGLKLAVATVQGQVEVKADGIDLAVLQVALQAIEGQTAAFAPSVTVKGGSFSLANRELVLANMVMDGGRLGFVIDQQGHFNWARLFTPPEDLPTTTAAPQKEKGASWRIMAPGMRAHEVRVQFEDRRRLVPLAADAAGLEGRLDLALASGTRDPVVVKRIGLAARALTVHKAGEAKAPALDAAAVRTRSGYYKNGELVLDGLELRKGRVRLLVAQDGRINWQDLLSVRATAAPVKKGATAQQQGLKLRLPNLRVEGLAVEYRDRSRSEPLAVDVQSLNAAMNMKRLGEAGQGLVDVDSMQLSLAGLSVGALDGKERPLTLKWLRATHGRFIGSTLSFDTVSAADGTVAAAVERDGMLNWQRLFARPAQRGSSGQAEVAHTTRARAKQSGQAPFSLRVPNFSIARIAARFDDRSRDRPVAVQLASLDAGMGMRLEAGAGGTRIVAENLGVKAAGIELASANAAQPVGRLGQLELSGGRIDTGTKHAAVQRIALTGGGVDLGRDEKGRLTLVDMFATPAAEGERSSPSKPTRPWTYQLDAVAVESFDVAYVDRTMLPVLSYNARIEKLALRGVDTTGKAATELEADVSSAEGGRLEATAKVAFAKRSGEGRVRLLNFDMRPLQPLFDRYALLRLESGVVSGAADVAYADSDKGRALKVRGDADIAHFQLNEIRTNDPFVSWRRLAAKEIRFATEPRQLAIGNVHLEGLRGKLEITRDRKLNVRKIVQERRDNQTGQAVEKRTGDAGEKAEQNQPLQVQVDRLHIVDGTLHYSDQSLILPFERDITALDATIVNISNRPEQHARLAARGSIAPFGLAEASGDISLASPVEYTNIHARFSNVLMPPLSPYTLTFAGYSIRAGSLWLDVRYVINDGQLAGTNDVIIDHLEIGKRLQESDGFHLPLPLAAKLLKDEQGRFNVRVPVRGDVKNPHFDYMQIVRIAFADTIRRVVTVPFRLVGRLFGVPGKLPGIAFKAGSAGLLPPEQDKLNNLADRLKANTRTSVVLQPTYDPDIDAQALRELLVKRELGRIAGFQLGPDEAPGPVAFTQVRTQHAIRALAEQRFGGGALQGLPPPVEESPGIPPPIQRDALTERAKRYEALFDRLVQTQPLPTAPPELAAQRAQAIARYLGEQEVPSSSVRPAAPEQIQATDDTVPTGMRLQGG